MAPIEQCYQQPSSACPTSYQHNDDVYYFVDENLQLIASDAHRGDSRSVLQSTSENQDEVNMREDAVDQWSSFYKERSHSCRDEDNNDAMGDQTSEETNPKSDEMPEFIRTLLDGVNRETKFDVPQNVRPPWFDEAKFKRGQKVFVDNYFSIMAAKVVGVVLIYAVGKSIGPIISTRKSDTPVKAFKRYTSTLVRVKSWYDNDPFEKGNKSYSNMAIVRVLHRNAFHKMLAVPEKDVAELITTAGKDSNPVWSKSCAILNEDFRSACPFTSSKLNIDGGTWINQLDMSLSQFGFSALAIMYPKQFGLHYVTEEELDDFAYVWKCYGHLLGVEDKFNFCNGSLKEVRQRGHDLLNYVLKPSLCEAGEDWEHTIRCLLEGLSYMVPGISFEGVFKFACDTLGWKVPRFEKTMTWGQKFACNFAWISFSYFYRIPGLRPLVNIIANFLTNWADGTTDEQLEKLAQYEYDYMKQSSGKNK